MSPFTPDNSAAGPVEDPSRERIRRLFEFVRALDERRNPIRLNLSEHRWSLPLFGLPHHPCVSLSREGRPASGDDETVEYLRVSRPILTSPPLLPEELEGWLEPGHEKWKAPLQVITERSFPQDDGSVEIVRFDADPVRPVALEGYREDRAAWEAAETPARTAFHLYERLYSLWSGMKREDETAELYVANSLLSTKIAAGVVRHPIVLMRVQLLFDPDTPEFRIVDAGSPPEAYFQLLQKLPNVPPQVFQEIRTEFRARPIHPLARVEELEAWNRRLAQWLHCHGDTSDTGAHTGGVPRVAEEPYLIWRSRSAGFAAALDDIIANIDRSTHLPPVLAGVVNSTNQPPVGEADPPAPAQYEDLLFALPANDRQAEIARRLQTRNGVVVQGPPGTGKTHTIANLIGQYLAAGKSVLVTSHAAKALRVVREQIPEPLRPLCVSVLEDDRAGRNQFKQSVRDISANLTLRRPVDEVAEATQRRQSCLSELRRVRRQLRSVLDAEYEPIVVGGDAIAPADAARFVAAQVANDGWIPSPIQQGEPAPLSDAAVDELYATSSLSPAAEQELRKGLPDSATVLTPAAFGECLAELREIQSLPAPDATLWKDGSPWPSGDCLNSLEGSVHHSLAYLERPDWLLQAIEDSRSDRTAAPWRSLLSIAQEAVSRTIDFRETELQFLPRLAGSPVEDQLQTLEAVLNHVNSGGSYQGFFFRLKHRAWSSLLNQVSVNGRRPRTVAELSALRGMAANEQRLSALRQRWERQVTAFGGPDPAGFGLRPESVYEQYCGQLQAHLSWTTDCWAPIEEQMGRIGLDWALCVARIAPVEGPLGQLRRTRSALRDVVLAEVAALRRAIRRRTIEKLLDTQIASLASLRAEPALELADAIRTKDEVCYARQYASLDELRALNPVFSRRQELLARLSQTAPSWAEAVLARTTPHDALLPPGNAGAAWRWRQLHDELERRSRLSLPQIQRELEDLTRNLQACTVDLIYKSAWAAQRQRLAQRPAASQSLQLLAQANDRAAGKGVQAARARTSIPGLMSQCRDAVPAWIMPLSRVAEYFDMASTRFDLVIVDEASQATLEGIVAMYLARRIVVVGDDEQVSPDAVGARLEGVDSLVSAYLHDFPGGNLFDFNYSLYDFATAHFGTPIRLREHFRCAPEIIQFSNALSYNFEIEPLRDMSRCSLRPHVIPYRCNGFRDAGTKQNVEEAETIASLVAAMCEIPEYDGATIGVITLLGGEQAELIDSLLRARMQPKEYENRRIVCGNASQFQGDERHVMLLSMVDSPNEKGGPLTLMQAGARDMYKKRYNVAASRAKDQMWVIHSLNPDTDLQPADLRYRLLQHARNPHALMDRINKVAAVADSEFERLVAVRLIASGYHVIPQWTVGPFRIDLVVQGEAAKLAVECDGDRYHTAENREQDLIRGGILSRCGWTIVRVRSTEFFRNPERALQPVLEELNEMGITPVIDGAEPSPPGPSPSDAVIRRAAEIRREWAEPPSEQPADIDRDSKDSDVRNAIHAVLGEAGCKREDLFAGVRTALGYQRLGARVRQRIAAALNAEMAAGRIRLVGRLLQRTPHPDEGKTASAGSRK